MRERARDKGRLADIIEFSNNVTMLIEGYTYDKFVADKRTYYSVMKNVEVVGENPQSSIRSRGREAPLPLLFFYRKVLRFRKKVVILQQKTKEQHGQKSSHRQH